MHTPLSRLMCFATLLMAPMGALAQSYDDPGQYPPDDGQYYDDGQETVWQSETPPTETYDYDGDGYADDISGQFQPAPTDLAPPVAPQAPVSIGMFEGSLNAYGTWVYIPGVGRAWRPYEQVVGAGFVPYATGGQWVNTPGGWTFRSRWPFGWATFHYGRWLLSQSFGWVWVPGFTWAPAWVDWRYNNGYVAWAPLPPPGFRVSFDYAAPGWNFVHRYYFGRPYVGRYLVPNDYRRNTRWWTRPYIPRGARPPPPRYHDRGAGWRNHGGWTGPGANRPGGNRPGGWTGPRPPPGNNGGRPPPPPPSGYSRPGAPPPGNVGRPPPPPPGGSRPGGPPPGFSSPSRPSSPPPGMSSPPPRPPPPSGGSVTPSRPSGPQRDLLPGVSSPPSRPPPPSGGSMSPPARPPPPSGGAMSPPSRPSSPPSGGSVAPPSRPPPPSGGSVSPPSRPSSPPSGGSVAPPSRPPPPGNGGGNARPSGPPSGRSGPQAQAPARPAMPGFSARAEAMSRSSIPARVAVAPRDTNRASPPRGFSRR